MKVRTLGLYGALLVVEVKTVIVTGRVEPRTSHNQRDARWSGAGNARADKADGGRRQGQRAVQRVAETATAAGKATGKASVRAAVTVTATAVTGGGGGGGGESGGGPGGGGLRHMRAALASGMTSGYSDSGGGGGVVMPRSRSEGDGWCACDSRTAWVAWSTPRPMQPG